MEPFVRTITRPITNFKLLQAIRERGWRQIDFVTIAKISSEVRMSRIINNRVVATEEEIAAISSALKKSRKSLGL